MYSWISYLRTNHFDLYRQYLEEQDLIRQTPESPTFSRFVALMVSDREWSTRVSKILEAKTSQFAV